jgi:hypothetical protein
MWNWANTWPREARDDRDAQAAARRALQLLGDFAEFERELVLDRARRDARPERVDETVELNGVAEAQVDVAGRTV